MPSVPCACASAMSLLATLGLELDRALLPASGLGWLVDYGKLPLAPAPLGPYEVLGGALEGGLPGGGEPLAGKDAGGGGGGRKGKNSFVHEIGAEGRSVPSTVQVFRVQGTPKLMEHQKTQETEVENSLSRK